jgi:hypothetical protein
MIQDETPLERDASRTAFILTKVAAERRRQDELVVRGKFPWNCAFDGPPYAEKLAVLEEEVGEVAREVTEHMITRDKYATDPHLKVMPPHREEFYRKRLLEELVQVAAVCVAWSEHLAGFECGLQRELEDERFPVVGSWSLGRILWSFECRCSATNVVPSDKGESTCSKCHRRGVRPES